MAIILWLTLVNISKRKYSYMKYDYSLEETFLQMTSYLYRPSEVSEEKFLYYMRQILPLINYKAYGKK